MANNFLSELREKSKTPEENEKDRIEQKIQHETNWAIRGIKERIVGCAENGEFQIRENGDKEIHCTCKIGISGRISLVYNEKSKNEFFHMQTIEKKRGKGFFRGSFDSKCIVKILVEDIVYDILSRIEKELIKENIRCKFEQEIRLYSDTITSKCNNSFHFVGNNITFETDWEDRSIVVAIVAEVSVVY